MRLSRRNLPPTPLYLPSLAVPWACVHSSRGAMASTTQTDQPVVPPPLPLCPTFRATAPPGSKGKRKISSELYEKGRCATFEPSWVSSANLAPKNTYILQHHSQLSLLRKKKSLYPSSFLSPPPQSFLFPPLPPTSPSAELILPSLISGLGLLPLGIPPLSSILGRGGRYAQRAKGGGRQGEALVPNRPPTPTNFFPISASVPSHMETNLV